MYRKKMKIKWKGSSKKKMRRRRVWLSEQTQKFVEQNKFQNFSLRNRVAVLHIVQGMHILQLNLPQKLLRSAVTLQKQTDMKHIWLQKLESQPQERVFPENLSFQGLQNRNIFWTRTGIMHTMPVKDGQKNGCYSRPERPEWPLGIKIYETKCTGTKNCVCPKLWQGVSFARITPRLVMSEEKMWKEM